MRVHVKPSLPDATIPDPARGRDLPPEGVACEWSVHWARLKARGDVIVTDIAEIEETPPPPAEDEAAPELAPEPEEHPDA